MDLNRYTEKKQKNLISIVKIDEKQAFVVAKKFDQATGEELNSEKQAINVADIEKRLEILNEQIAELNAFLTDVKEVVKPSEK